MTEQSIHYLVKKLLQNECTPEEKNELARYIAKSGNDLILKTILEEAWFEFKPSDQMPADKAESILSSILASEEQHQPAVATAKYSWLERLSVAAVFLILLGAGSYFLIYNGHRKDMEKVAVPAEIVNNDAHPGKRKGELTIADGSVIILDTFSDGLITQQGNTQVTGKEGGLLYHSTDDNASTTLYNKLSTRRGELCPLTLSDGSKVWLNAASSIRFPVAFTGKERLVEITGEAYFEVAKNPARPFTVTLNGMEIKVLGTHFNVNGYADEPIVKTTLLEGSLSVTKGTSSVLLIPGQQANLKGNGKIDLLKAVDTDEAVSWKDGYFHFNNSSLETVMHQLSRWYNVDVVFETKKTSQTFSGDVDRNSNLSQVIKVLERSEVHSRIEGKKLIVLE